MDSFTINLMVGEIRGKELMKLSKEDFEKLKKDFEKVKRIVEKVKKLMLEKEDPPEAVIDAYDKYNQELKSTKYAIQRIFMARVNKIFEIVTRAMNIMEDPPKMEGLLPEEQELFKKLFELKKEFLNNIYKEITGEDWFVEEENTENLEEQLLNKGNVEQLL